MRKELHRNFLVKGAISAMTVTTKERPTHTSFGSTDKKGYIAETTIVFDTEKKTVYTSFEPWETDVKELIKEIEENAKHKFANELYESGKLDPQ